MAASLKWYLYPVKWLVFLFAWFYIGTILAITTLFAWVYWYLRIICSGSYPKTRRRMKEILESMKEFDPVQTRQYFYHNAFQYIYDGLGSTYDERRGSTGRILTVWPTWIPTPMILVFRDFYGNCDDADVFARWLLKSLKKQRPTEYADLKYKRMVYVPLKPKYMFTKVHYITVARIPNTPRLTLFSSGQVILDAGSPDDIPARLLGQDEPYTWLHREL